MKRERSKTPMARRRKKDGCSEFKYLDFADFVSLELWSAVVVDESDASCQLQRRNGNEVGVRASRVHGFTRDCRK